MRAAPSIARHPQTVVRECRTTTLLALVRAVSEETSDEREVIATILHMLRSGEVRLCGNFRNAPLDVFDE